MLGRLSVGCRIRLSFDHSSGHSHVCVEAGCGCGAGAPPRLQASSQRGFLPSRRGSAPRCEAPAGTAPPPGYEYRDLYSMHVAASATEWALAGRAVQIVAWAETHRYCGRCGAATEFMSGERAMRCPACALVAYPRIAPAVITLVHRGDEALLARGRRFPRPMYSAIAGFVEPGETVEHTVVREIREEVGVTVGTPRYVGSQPWPFPHSLMLGFEAAWVAGDIVIDETEITDAGWFHYARLPTIPPPISIAHDLIVGWAQSRR